MEDKYSTPEKQEERAAICKTCPRYWVSEDGITYCLEANKSIGYQIAENNNTCPLRKW